MSCKCIEKVEAKLRKDTGDPEARLNYNRAKKIDGVYYRCKAYIPIETRFRKKKKDGTLGLRKTTDYTTGAYCPFCGKKL